MVHFCRLPIVYMIWLPLSLLSGCAPEPECGGGWTRERYSNEFADAWCTMREECYHADYGWFEGPDHAGCVANVTLEMEAQLDQANADSCNGYDSCTAQRNVEELKAAASTCKDSPWSVFSDCAEW